jgi:hypothetical protein
MILTHQHELSYARLFHTRRKFLLLIAYSVCAVWLWLVRDIASMIAIPFYKGQVV